jgi:hypothetical protein
MREEKDLGKRNYSSSESKEKCGLEIEGGGGSGLREEIGKESNQ